MVDDGSTDDTPAVMASYGDRIIYHRLAENGGIAAARTAACQRARGELIAFQDDDDIMPAERISALHDALCRFPTAVYAVGDMAIIDDAGSSTGSRWLPERRNSPDPTCQRQLCGCAVAHPAGAAPHHIVPPRRRSAHWLVRRDIPVRRRRQGFLRQTGKARPGRVRTRSGFASAPRTRIVDAQLDAHRILGDASVSQTPGRTPTRPADQTAALQRRLQWRIGLSLQRIAAHRSAGIELPDYIPADYVRQWLPLTGMRDRVNYRWQTWLRQPLRRLIKGPN